ncbi:MAG: hydrolase [Pontibacterium sp.]
MSAIIHATEADILKQLSLQRPWMETRLLELVNLNSGTQNYQGVNAVGALISALFSERLAAPVEKIQLDPWQKITLSGQSVESPLASLWCLRKRPRAPLQVLLCGHLDTVFPLESGFQQATYLTENTLNGPGAADMKGGLLVMLAALEALEQHPLCANLGWTVLLNPDEEIGSPGSAAWLAKEAVHHHIGLVYEPCLPDGCLAGARKGSGNFSLLIQGRSAHAGREPENGRNAIVAAARTIGQLEALNGVREGLTLNTGIIAGGETTNQVPDLTVVKFNIRIKTAQDAHWSLMQLEKIQQSINQCEGFSARLYGGFGRMPKQLDHKHLALYQLVKDCGAALNLELNWQPTGGCCDGNNLSNLGLANIDTLGVRGGFIHSVDEYICLDSLTERAGLSALLLFQLAHHGLPFYPAPET